MRYALVLALTLAFASGLGGLLGGGGGGGLISGLVNTVSGVLNLATGTVTGLLNDVTSLLGFRDNFEKIGQQLVSLAMTGLPFHDELSHEDVMARLKALIVVVPADIQQDLIDYASKELAANKFLREKLAGENAAVQTAVKNMLFQRSSKAFLLGNVESQEAVLADITKGLNAADLSAVEKVFLAYDKIAIPMTTQSGGLLDGVSKVVGLPSSVLGFALNTVNLVLGEAAATKLVRTAVDSQGQGFAALLLGNFLKAGIDKEELMIKLSAFLVIAPDDFRNQITELVTKQLGSYDALGGLLDGKTSEVQGAVKKILLLRADKSFLSGGADAQKKAIAGVTASLTSSQGKLVDQILADHKDKIKALGLPL